ncbi:MAG: hypothetical protein WCA39_18280 [Nitrososphaeraceae archaeon]
MSKSVIIAVVIAAIAAVALAPSLILSKPANAVVQISFCEKSFNTESGVDACKTGWNDHDHCRKYDSSAYIGSDKNAYKVGWDHGSCKK